MKVNDSPLKQKSFRFALRIVRLHKYLTEEKKEYIISKQLMRSGTSVGANVREAQNAQSSADFIHKLHISQKECDETLYWLELLYESQYLNEQEFNSISLESAELLKMLKSAILTSKQKL